MATPNTDTVADAHARSVTGPTVGFCDATTTTTDESVDLSAWAGRYVEIYCEGDDHYVCFSASSAETIETGAQAVGTAAVPIRIYVGQAGVHRLVPRKATFLIYRAVAGTGVIRVVPA